MGKSGRVGRVVSVRLTAKLPVCIWLFDELKRADLPISKCALQLAFIRSDLLVKGSHSTDAVARIGSWYNSR